MQGLDGKQVPPGRALAAVAGGVRAGRAGAGGVAGPGGYPNRPVHILVPYGPGGVADTTTRLLAQKLNERLGQTFVIENRPGAGGIVASKAGATAAPGRLHAHPDRQRHRDRQVAVQEHPL